MPPTVLTCKYCNQTGITCGRDMNAHLAVCPKNPLK